MSDGQGGARGVLAGAVMLAALAPPAFAQQVHTLTPHIATPLKSALQSLDAMCASGSLDACVGAGVLRERQARLLATNARCARGRSDACTGLVSAGYELEALAQAVAREAEARRVLRQ